MTIFQIFVGIGGALSFYLGVTLQNQVSDEKSFKVTYIAQIIPILLLLFFGFMIPESPKWLATHCQWKDVSRHLLAIEKRYTGSDLTTLGSCLTKNVNSPVSEYCEYKELFGKNYIKRTVLALVLHIFIQLIGFTLLTNTFVYVCSACGLGRQTCMIVSSLQYVIFIIFHMFPLFMLDKCRRKDSLVFGMFLLGTTLITLSMLMVKFGTEEGPNYSVEHSPFKMNFSGQTASGILALCLFIPAIYAATISSSSLLYVGELFPDIAKSKGYSLCICTSWMMNSIISFVYPTILRLLGSWLFLMVGIFGFVTGLILMSYPETYEPLDKELEILNYYTCYDIKRGQSKKSTRTTMSSYRKTQTSYDTSLSRSFGRKSSHLSKASPTFNSAPKLFNSQFTTARFDDVDGKLFMNETVSQTVSPDSKLKTANSTKISDKSNSFTPTRLEVFTKSDSTIEPITGMQTAMINFNALQPELNAETRNEDSDDMAGIIDDYVNDSDIAMTAPEQPEEETEAIKPENEVKAVEPPSSLEWFEYGKDSTEPQPRDNHNLSAVSLDHYSPETSSPLFLQSSVQPISTPRKYKSIDRAKLKGGLFLSPGFSKEKPTK